MFAETQRTSFAQGVCQQLPWVGGGMSALPGSWVLPSPANKEEFTGNPSLEDLYFPFQGLASLKPSLVLDHFSCQWSGAGATGCPVGLGVPWGWYPHPRGAPSPSGGDQPAWAKC